MRFNKTRRTPLRIGAKIALFGVIVTLLFSPLVQAFNTPIAEAKICIAPVIDGVSTDLINKRVTVGDNEDCPKDFTASSDPTLIDQVFADPLETLADWIANIVYYVMVGLFSTFAYITAAFFSFAVQITLNSSAYALEFITTSWQIVRDLANMAFIFILVYIAFLVMLKADTAGTMRMLAGVIVVALIVNFSFFLTRVVIDSGNILAVQFYNLIPGESIAVNNSTNNATLATYAASSVGSWALNGQAKDLTASIMSGINVTDLTSTDSFQRYQQSQSSGFWYTLVALSLIYFGAGIVFAILAGTFLFAGVKFMLRTVGLIFLIIASPLALIARAIGHPKTIGLFNKWLDGLIRWSFYPAVFLFMFWVITIFMTGINDGGQGSFIGSIFTDSGSVGNSGFITQISLAIAQVGIKLGFVIAMLYIALSTADYITKEAGSGATKGLRWGLGFARGVGRRTGGFAFQRTVGQTASAVNRGLQGTRWANKPGLLGGLGYSAQKGAQRVAGTSVGGVRSYTDVQKARDVREKEQSGNLVKIQYKEDRQRLAEIDKTFDERRLNELQKRKVTGPVEDSEIRPGEDRERERLEDLQKERDVLSDRVKSFTPPQLESFKAGEIEQVIKHITESQMKAIKDSSTRSDQDKNKLEQAWHEKAADAPLKKASQQIELLRKINGGLSKDGVLLATISSKLGTEDAPRNTIVDTGLVEALREEIETQRDRTRSELGRKRGEDTAAEQTKLRKFGEAIKHLDKLGEELKKVPATVGGVERPNTFDTSKVT